MLARNYRDMIAGGVIAAMGLVISIHSFLNLEMGVARQMGPGMVPFWLGLVLVLCGAAILVSGYRTEVIATRVPFRPALFVTLAIVAFALAVPHLGVIPAVFLLVVISTLAEGALSVPRMLALGFGLSAFCFVVFDLLLRLSMPMFDWRF